ncbi:dienelactone hydrolase family protein [Streptomyces sp. NPDC059582]|uniref:dienelactone hydrolase family protein n=1 Tax=Streptomyces sp. NPDC059582 TaxID=3346875 RepID=UPI0036BA721D
MPVPADRIAAAAGFHGAHLATDAPASPHLLADRVTPSCTSATPTRMRPTRPGRSTAWTRPSARRGVRHRGETYAGAQHGCTQADTASYSEEDTERHWAALPDLFGRRL